MKTFKTYLLSILVLVPILAVSQIPEGHFLDVDKTAERGYVLKPFKQENKRIYHYAVLSDLPFKNNCESGLSEKERIECSEKNLRKLIYLNLPSDLDFSGNAYLYLTVGKDSKIVDITVRSYPNSDIINSALNQAVEKIQFNVGRYDGQTVDSRLWTSFTFPSSSKELLSESLMRMKDDNNPKYEDYESLVFDASSYVFSNPVNVKSKEFRAATNIVSFWMNKDTGMGIPTFGDFFDSLTNKNQQQFLFTVAMINYGLDQKLIHGRFLECIPKKGEIYSERTDVREVQLEGAKILLEFIGKENNNVPMTSKTRKYFKAYKKGKLKEMMF